MIERKCVVPECPEVACCFAGYLFTRKGEEITSDPKDPRSFGWCTRHIEEVGVTIAVPIFDSADAALLFAEKHPQKYFRDVAPKRQIILGKP